jgi:hypothetical protein
MSVLHFSEQLDQIIPALAILQENMEDVKKNATNPHFKSKYADLGAVLDAVWPALAKAKLVLLQPPAGSIESDGDYYVVIETWFVHASGQFARWEFKLPTTKDDPQGAGSAITYGRRYSLQSFLGIAPEDDDGNAASRQRTQSAARNDPPQSAVPPGKIPPSKMAHFAILEGKMPAEEFAAAIAAVQKHFRHPETGKVSDLYEGDEARDAYARIKRLAEQFNAA